MSRCLVTGAAGFIGSHLCEELIVRGHEVVGVDAFIPYYPRAIKEANLEFLLQDGRFSFQELDLRADDLESAMEGCDVVFHEAAMAGLMRSWSDFELYASCNMMATKRLLEAARQQPTAKSGQQSVEGEFCGVRVGRVDHRQYGSSAKDEDPKQGVAPAAFGKQSALALALG